MEITKKKTWVNSKNIIFLTIGIIVMYLGVNTLVDNRFEDIEISTREQIAEQQTLLAAIAEATARNGADSVTESIVKDCTPSERGRFDTLLGRLDKGLNYSELTELERLFGRCGSFYSERKSVMVSRLTREIEIFEGYVEYLSAITSNDLHQEFLVSSWKQLADEEKKLSQLFSNLVDLQDEIITTLLDGKSASSPEILEILYKVNEVQQTLAVTTSQTSNLRSELISF